MTPWDEIGSAEEEGWGEPAPAPYPVTEDELYAELQAESNAAADLDPDWPATYE